MRQVISLYKKKIERVRGMLTMDKRIKERREQLLKLLRDRSVEGHSRYRNSTPSYRSFHSDVNRVELKRGRWVWQIPLSVLLLLGIFVTTQSNHPYASIGQAWIHESLTREFNFAGVEQWYNERFAGSPSILPKLTFNDSSNSPSVTEVIAPVHGQVLTRFQGKGITIQTTKSSNQVVAMSEGWVTFVGEMEDLGLTVVISHVDGKESWYSWLEETFVEKNDVVKGGYPIGTVSSNNDAEEGLLYFSVKESNQFTDPLGVVQFED
jgi:stage IV sporulation protein FA